MSDENKIRDAADAVRGIVEAVPVYEDVVQPAAREIGTALQTIAKTVHIALAPIEALIWSYDTIRDFVSTRVAEKLKDVPLDRIKTPEPHVVAPALQALVYCGHQESLRELYANLLATSLDYETAELAHPGFVEIIKNMSPDEARIMRLFSIRERYPIIEIRLLTDASSLSYYIPVRRYSLLGKEAACSFPNLTPNYLDNLERLGLIESPGTLGNVIIKGADVYEPLEQSHEIVELKTGWEAEGYRVEFAKSFVQSTDLGKQFCKACVIEKSAR